MTQKPNNWPVRLYSALAPLIGWIKGSEAKQKFLFRIRSLQNQKKSIASEKKLVKKGGVALDDVELSAFHRN